MQSYIEGLAKGIFSYDVPQIIIENDNLDLKAIEAGVGICLQTVFLFDEKGLDL